MTLLLGPPGAGKTTLLKALAGKLTASGLDVSLASSFQGCIPVDCLQCLSLTLQWPTCSAPANGLLVQRLPVATLSMTCCSPRHPWRGELSLFSLQVSGDITYNGHTLTEFYPQRTSEADVLRLSASCRTAKSHAHPHWR